MSFVDVRFPDDIAYGSGGGPEYATDIVVTESGYEKRNSNWLNARARYNVAHGVKTKAQLDELIAFFRARKGRAHSFRFKDWADYTAVGQQIGTGDGSQTTFLLVKSYTSGGITEPRMITKPVSGTIKIYKNGLLQSSGVSISPTTGLVIFTAAPANGEIISADFEFDVPVRFDTDRLSTSLDSYGIGSWLDIPLVEVRMS